MTPQKKKMQFSYKVNGIECGSIANYFLDALHLTTAEKARIIRRFWRIERAKKNYQRFMIK